MMKNIIMKFAKNKFYFVLFIRTEIENDWNYFVVINQSMLKDAVESILYAY